MSKLNSSSPQRLVSCLEDHEVSWPTLVRPNALRRGRTLNHSTVKYESLLLQRNSPQRLNATTIFLSDRGYNTRRVRADSQGEEEDNRHRRPNKRGHHFRASIPLAADHPPNPHLLANKRAYKTTTALFPFAIEDRKVGKITWQDFTYTMYRLEFKIRRYNFSEWYFEPTWRLETRVTISLAAWRKR